MIDTLTSISTFLMVSVNGKITNGYDIRRFVYC